MTALTCTGMSALTFQVCLLLFVQVSVYLPVQVSVYLTCAGISVLTCAGICLRTMPSFAEWSSMSCVTSSSTVATLPPGLSYRYQPLPVTFQSNNSDVEI